MARTVATPRPRPSRRQAWLAGRCSPPTAGLEACAVGLAPLLVASAGLEACVASARRPRPARCCCSLPYRPGARGLLDGGAPRRVSGPCPSLHAAGRQEACADRPPPPAAGHPLPAAPRRKPLRPGRCSPSRPATRRAQPARRLRSLSRSARPPWWTAGRGSMWRRREMVATAIPFLLLQRRRLGFRGHPLSLCPSARASRRSRFQPSASRGEGGAGSAPLEPGATEVGGGVVEAQAVPPLQPSLRPTERGGVGGGGAAAVRHEVEGGRRRGWRVGEGGGGRRDEQSLPSMLGRTASIFFCRRGRRGWPPTFGALTYRNLLDRWLQLVVFIHTMF
ncbi:hypothetical protein PVAP13_3KG239027 [Panicum virgatum]|uniref:Uncharacterized protein n=1 Tax=Panicum virgatum TaxID=38727 RepID=A0A8T0V2C3_PANVG|nr:hypothetical protein PVAP13_3KG239027 [Panicum virgatum]